MKRTREKEPDAATVSRYRLPGLGRARRDGRAAELAGVLPRWEAAKAEGGARSELSAQLAKIVEKGVAAEVASRGAAANRRGTSAVMTLATRLKPVFGTNLFGSMYKVRSISICTA